MWILSPESSQLLNPHLNPEWAGAYSSDMESIPFCQFQFYSIPFGQFQFHIKLSIPILNFSIPILFLLTLFLIYYFLPWVSTLKT